MAMFDAAGNLVIFESFRVDHNLPKFKVDEDEASSEDSAGFSQKRLPRITFNSGQILISNPAQGLITSQEGFFSRAWSWVKERLSPAPIPVEEFFRSVKNSAEELIVVDGRSSGYEAAIKAAGEAGQVALVEKLIGSAAAVRGETQLIALGLKKYIDEESLYKFAVNSSRHLALDWISNFTRFIPKKVIETKKKADERGVFDNYVILHYDPDGKNREDTEEEKRRIKDPILFGVIRGRRRLYFVGDWIDEICDLTFDQIADSLGKDIGELKEDVY